MHCEILHMLLHKTKHWSVPYTECRLCWLWYYRLEHRDQQGISLVLEVVLFDMRTLQECCCSHETQPHSYTQPFDYQSTAGDVHEPVWNVDDISESNQKLNSWGEIIPLPLKINIFCVLCCTNHNDEKLNDTKLCLNAGWDLPVPRRANMNQ